MSLGLWALWLPAFAEVEEIVVLANKTAESAQAIGLSLRALDDAEIRETRANDLGRLTELVPGVHAFANSSAIQSVFIRGVGQNEFVGNFDSPTGTYLDEGYLSKSWMNSHPLFDLARVEVLKGPQGTLFGRNTTGGAVSYFTHEPSNALAYGTEVTADNHLRYDTEGYLNLPLSDELAARMAYSIAANNGGPWDNTTLGDEQGGPEYAMGRFKLRWARAGTALRLSVHGGYDQSELVPYASPGIFAVGGGLCAAVFSGEIINQQSSCLKYGGAAAARGRADAELENENPQKIAADIVNARDDRFGGAQLRAEHQASSATITSITAYEHYRSNWHDSTDDSPLGAVLVNYFDDIEQFTEELRVSAQPVAWYRYVVGSYFEHSELKQTNSVDLSRNPLGILPPALPRLASDLTQEVNAAALFLHNEFEVRPTMTLIAAARVTYESNEFSALTSIARNDPQGDEDRVTPVLATTFNAAGVPIALEAKRGVFRDTHRDKNVSWRTGAEWFATENVLVYGNLATGYRAGGFSAPFGGEVTEFDHETIFSRDIGIKAWLFSQRLEINASGFHYTYHDVQVNVDDPASPLVPFTQNIGTQEGRGGELDLWWSPDDHWDLRAGASYLDAEFVDTDAVIGDYTAGLSGRLTPLVGNRPVNAPQWTTNTSLRYERPLVAGWRVVFGGWLRWVDERYLEVTNRPFDRAPSYVILNARVAINSPNQRWELALWGNNVTDTDYLTYLNNIQFFTVHVYGEPASYGLTARYRFR